MPKLGEDVPGRGSKGLQERTSLAHLRMPWGCVGLQHCQEEGSERDKDKRSDHVGVYRMREGLSILS